jgi:hypothetical protein
LCSGIRNPEANEIGEETDGKQRNSGKDGYGSWRSPEGA